MENGWATDFILKTMAELIECRDDILDGHIDRTQRYLGILIGELAKKSLYSEEISNWNVNLVLQSSLLHDIGKISIKDYILQKPGKLTDEEFKEIKMHTAFGEKIIEKIKRNAPEQTFLGHAKIFAGTHHEKWDGSGYPKGLKGKEIPLQGRLMAIADVYDALVSYRPYKKIFSHEKAISVILSGKGTHFDPDLIAIFMNVSDEFDKITKNCKQNAATS
jgi:putative two-component system response regulator